MGFNYAKEKAKFDAKWKKLRAEYEDAGMCQEDIQAMRDYDWNVFCSDRVYRNHTQALPDELLAGEERDGLNMLFRNYVTLSTSFGIEDFEERFAWLDTIRCKRFHSKLLALSPKDVELLTFIVLDGHDQHELAQKWRCTQSAISQRLKKIKLFLK